MRHVVRAVLAAVTFALAAAPADAQKASAEAAPLKKGPSSDAAAPAKKVLDSSDTIPRRGFNVVLLLGDLQGPGYPKPIPEAALRALSDMRDFLPYKGYNLLDTQWITPHLEQFGTTEIPRDDYLKLLTTALKREARFIDPVNKGDGQS